MLKGFATVAYYAADLEAAEKWYSELLGIEAYFHVPGYTEFRVGPYQHELGIIDARYAPPGAVGSPAGEIIQWHVDDVDEALERLLALGATLYQQKIERGGGFITGSVVDPFGNILGVIYNPHFLEVLAEGPDLDSARSPQGNARSPQGEARSPQGNARSPQN